MGRGRLLTDQLGQRVSEGVSHALGLARGTPDSEGAAPVVIQVNVFVTYGPARIHQEVVVGDTINISNVQNAVVNIKGTLHSASVAIGAAPVDASSKEELQSLLTRLEAALTREAVAKPDSTEAISDAAKELIEKASRERPNRKSVESAARGLLDLAKDVADALPVATQIASAVAAIFGITL